MCTPPPKSWAACFARLSRSNPACPNSLPPPRRWRRWRRRAGHPGAQRRAPNTRRGSFPLPSGGLLDLGEIMGWLRDRLPDDAIVTSDAGNFSGWPNRFLQYRRPGRQLGPTSGAMGYGVPAAVAAKLVHPDRLVVGFCGDGGFMMTGQELATAMLEGTGPIILVFNNAMYGTIRMHQERRFPGRVVGTALKNPDFLALARAYGVFGASVARTEEFAPAFEEAASGKPGGDHRAQDGSGDDHDAHDIVRDPPASRGAPGRAGGGVRMAGNRRAALVGSTLCRDGAFRARARRTGARAPGPTRWGADSRSRLRRWRADRKNRRSGS